MWVSKGRYWCVQGDATCSLLTVAMYGVWYVVCGMWSVVCVMCCAKLSKWYCVGVCIPGVCIPCNVDETNFPDVRSRLYISHLHTRSTLTTLSQSLIISIRSDGTINAVPAEPLHHAAKPIVCTYIGRDLSEVSSLCVRVSEAVQIGARRRFWESRPPVVVARTPR